MTLDAHDEIFPVKTAERTIPRRGRGHSVPRLGRWQWVLVLAAVLAGGGLASAQTILRCDNGAVQVGDSALTAGRACGPADAVTRSLVERGIAYDNRGRTQIGAVLSERRVVERERWEYAGSRGRLARTLVFEDGVLVEMKLGGYGR